MLYTIGRPARFADSVVTHTQIKLSLLDRLKVLFGWHLTLDCRTWTENVVGEAESVSEVIVWRARRRTIGAVLEL